MSKTSRFTSKAVTLAKNVVGALRRLRTCFAPLSPDLPRRIVPHAFDLLSEIPHILADIVLFETDLLDHSTLVKAFDRFQMEVWRVLLRLSAQLYDLSGRAAIDATFFDRENASKHCCRQTNYRVQTFKTTALVDFVERLDRNTV